MTLLLIGAGSQAYRAYLLRSVAEEYDIHLLADREPTWETPYLSGHTVLDTTDVAAMREAARALPCEGVLTWDDTRVVQTARLAAGLGLPGTPPEAALRCRDKRATREALDRAGVPQAQSILVTSLPQARAAAARVGYPLVLKPRALNASTGVVKVESADALARSFRLARAATAPGAQEVAPGDVLVEEYLDGPEVSVDAAWHEGRMTPAFVARKECGFAPYFEETGHLIDGGDALLSDPRLLEVVQAAHTAVGFTTGWTHTELRLTARGPRIVEINARIGGDRIPDIGRLALGVDAARTAAQVACGRLPELTARDRRVAAVRFLYPETDCIARDVRIEPGALPGSVDSAEAIALPGQEIRLPPNGHVSGRYALITVAGESAEQCRADLDKASQAVALEVLRAL
ncbi:ATP-grasp domain-containing protein [Streptomyces albidocamelliae]|uniref:ATP-grasp domain-containing protein n=1 Tax=Streptomyces albidocamelliae TaxID=2981135 RepID=A0ABY6EFD9_9ACTN|nr:ATP-grasp domain-containing protein [Streptomyces sp. HUAS 14-6]UXY33419.1 ATP-grasp domain-containing protein [Streptomyces sp. HUAS 14-6]